MSEEDKKYNIAMVDDDKFLLGMYVNKFNNSGHKAEGFTSGEALLEKLREDTDTDIIILDVVMPDMDGIKILENIRKENLVPKSIVIMLTNQETENVDIKRAKELGVAGYIVKATMVPSEVVDIVMKIAKEKGI